MSFKIQLYELLPYILRYRDEQAKLGPQGPLESFISILQSEAESTSADIKGLADLIDAEVCDKQFLTYISLFLGTMEDNTKVEAFRRFFCLNLAMMYKKAGTQLSWKQWWKWQIGRSYEISELYKASINETWHYSKTKDVTTPLKSARYSLADGPYLACMSGCESGVELDREETLIAQGYIEHDRPIHVIPKKQTSSEDLVDSIAAATEDITGSQVTWSPSDSVPEITEDMEVATTCLGSCETACEGCCETGCQCVACEMSCEAQCESLCETMCQSSCESFCQANCQTWCEFRCEMQCEVQYCQAGGQEIGGGQGTQGSQGYQGSQGTQGRQGYQGAQGWQGPQGYQGPEGYQGPQGVAYWEAD